MYYSRNKNVVIVSLVSIVMIVFGMYYGSVYQISLNYVVLALFIVINGLNIYLTETNNIVLGVLIFTFIASSVVVSNGYIGMHFDISNPLILLIVTYLLIKKSKESRILASIALVVAVVGVLIYTVIEPTAFPAFIGSLLFYVAFLLNVFNITKSSQIKSRSSLNDNSESTTPENDAFWEYENK